MFTKPAFRVKVTDTTGRRGYFSWSFYLWTAERLGFGKDG